MQSALRLAARRAAWAGSRRGVATTSTKAAADTVAGEAESEWVSALVEREVRAQMREAKGEEALALVQREMRAAKEEEALALLCARNAAIVGGCDEWKRGFKMGYGSCFLGCAYLAVFYYIVSR